MDVEALAALRVRPEVEREVEIAMREFLAYSLDRRPRSLAFLDEVRAAPRDGRRLAGRAVPARADRRGSSFATSSPRRIGRPRSRCGRRRARTQFVASVEQSFADASSTPRRAPGTGPSTTATRSSASR